MPNAALWLGRLDRANARIEVRDVENGTYRIISDPYWLPISRLVHPTTKKAAYAFGLTFSTKTRADELIERCERAAEDGRTWRPQNKTTAGHHRGGGEWKPGDTEPRDTHYEDNQTTICPTCQDRPPAGTTCSTCQRHTPPRQEDHQTSEPERGADLTEPQTHTGLDKAEVKAIAQEAIDEAWIDQEASILAKVQRPNVVMVQIDKHETRKVSGLTHAILPQVILAVNAGRNVMLVGPAGTGKSTIAEQAAEALGLEFVTISVDGSMMRDELFGYTDVNGNPVMRAFYDAYKNGKLFCIDEIDNGHPSIISGLNQAIANRGVQFPHEYVTKHANFRLIATANTYGTGPDAQYVGRSQLDAATLNRFVRLTVPNDEAIETNIAHGFSEDADMVNRWLAEVRRVRANIERHGLKYVVSPRQSFDGVALMAEGWTWEQCRDACLFAGMTAETRRKADEG